MRHGLVEYTEMCYIICTDIMRKRYFSNDEKENEEASHDC